MPYNDLMERLLGGEAVPRSEIHAHLEELPYLQVDLYLEYAILCGVLAKSYSSGMATFQLTPLGQHLRQDLVRRIEGDCPECPEIP